MKLVCAPMASITHAAFRTLVESFGGGCDEYYSEMIGAGAFISGGPYEKWYAIEEPVPEKMVWQVVGGDVNKIVCAAKRLAEKGGIGVDINMGCSAPDILRARGGAAWLDRGNEEIRSMVKAVRSAVKSVDKNKRVSVKMRIGGKEVKEGQLKDTVRMLYDEGVERIAIHARSEKEKYRTAAHWKIVGDAVKDIPLDVSIALNGDIKDFASYTLALESCPRADCVMIGRQAVRTPWIFEVLKAKIENKPLSMKIDREEAALKFIEGLKQYQPKDFLCTRCKRFFTYYAEGLSFAHYFAVQMANAKGIEDAVFRVKDYFMRQGADRVLTI